MRDASDQFGSSRCGSSRVRASARVACALGDVEASTFAELPVRWWKEQRRAQEHRARPRLASSRSPKVYHVFYLNIPIYLPAYYHDLPVYRLTRDSFVTSARRKRLFFPPPPFYLDNSRERASVPTRFLSYHFQGINARRARVQPCT